MERGLDQQVFRRASGLCEYCHAPQAFYPERFQIDHIRARQHRGDDSLENLALACLECNRRKGPNIACIDPQTGQLVPLFNPRKDRWNDHFEWRGGVIVGISKIRRATVALLDLNRAPRIGVREALIEEGVFPPPADRRG